MRAFPVAIVLILACLAQHGLALAQAPQKGWIGITVETVTPEKKLAIAFGAQITGIAPESPAVSELKIGDVIFAVNGQPIQTAEAFVAEIEALAPGSKARLSVSRERHILTPEITIAARQRRLLWPGRIRRRAIRSCGSIRVGIRRS